ncbi:MAG: hypothetical protein ACREMY_24780, partial [bacterium]
MRREQGGSEQFLRPRATCLADGGDTFGIVRERLDVAQCPLDIVGWNDEAFDAITHEFRRRAAVIG